MVKKVPLNSLKMAFHKKQLINTKDIKSMIMNPEAEAFVTFLKRLTEAKTHLNMYNSATMELLPEKQNISTFIPEMRGLINSLRKWKTGQPIIRPI